jgi:DNA-binding transcriptional ArsR family regulator
MRTTTPPDTVARGLFGELRRNLLALMFADPGRAYYVRELARILDSSAGTVQRELGLLTDMGLLVRSRRGRHVFYEANTRSPVFPEVKGLLEKTMGAADVLRAALAPLADRIRAAVLFGSLATGKATHRSDADVLVIGDVEFSEVSDALAPAEQRLGREVQAIVYTPQRFASRVREGGHFPKAVLSGPHVSLIGELPSGA